MPPSIRVFSNESSLHMKWPKYWSFSFSIIPSKEIPGLISFRMDWLDLSPRDSQESSPTPSSKASILQRSAFFTVQLSHPYVTTGKTIALTRWTFVGIWFQVVSIDHLVMSMCRVIFCVVGRGCLLWPVHSLGRTLLAFALLHSPVSSAICLCMAALLDQLTYQYDIQRV